METSFVIKLKQEFNEPQRVPENTHCKLAKPPHSTEQKTKSISPVGEIDSPFFV